MNIIAVIPARYASTRLPAKPLALIAKKTLIQRVYEAVAGTELFRRVIIATDHTEIYKHCQSFKAEVKMTSPEHTSGTDRMHEAVQDLVYDIAVNVQGDEPFITREPLQALIDVFSDESIKCASLMHTFENPEEIQDPNNVKVVTDNYLNALYFSRSVIPYGMADGNVAYYKHIGVYAYRPQTLDLFVSLPKGKLETIERLEQLRLLENGIKIKMVATEYKGIGIDTQADVVQAEALLKAKRKI